MFFGNGLSHLYTDNKEKVPSAPLGLAHLYYGSEVPHTASTLSDPQIQQVDHSLVNAQKPHRIESQGNSIPGTSASMIHRPLKRTSSQIQESEGKKVKKEHNATSSSPSSAQSFLEWTKEADQSFHRALFGNEKSLTTLAHLPPAQRRRGSIFPERTDICHRKNRLAFPRV
ncbi:hypothetical protein BT96DRAFT_277111 [Gymnopus androsaceus JB14]|uniref:Uncharacterized protein n=1 Tax=Gymnopus androsaceus JB14 TaxID=1447944 RepID=A0A6A4H5A8_9AGAR|nr:hypothetical protein BT96DRAFT_277111 [Gymnopus androsaceus JB14]